MVERIAHNHAVHLRRLALQLAHQQEGFGVDAAQGGVGQPQQCLQLHPAALGVDDGLEMQGQVVGVQQPVQVIGNQRLLNIAVGVVG